MRSAIIAALGVLIAATQVLAQVTIQVWRGATVTESNTGSNQPISLTLDAAVTRVNVFATAPAATSIGGIIIDAAAPVDLFLGQGALIEDPNEQLPAIANNFGGVVSIGLPVRFSGSWGGNLTGPITVSTIVRGRLLGDIQAHITTTNAGSLSTIDLGWLEASRITNGAAVQSTGTIGNVIIRGTGTALNGSITSTNGAINRLDIERGDIGTPASPAAVTAFEEIGTFAVGSVVGGGVLGGNV